jgi:hypothetical protein
VNGSEDVKNPNKQKSKSVRKRKPEQKAKKGGKNGEKKRTPLKWGNFGAVDENILASAHLEGRLLDLNLNNLGRMENDLGNVGAQASANLAPHTLTNIEGQSSNHPLPKGWRELFQRR